MMTRDFEHNKKIREAINRLRNEEVALKAEIFRNKTEQAEALVAGYRKDGILDQNDLPAEIRKRWFDILFN